ncbi:ribosomal silencing factor RsfS [Clostridia bacterium]|nr:ribosomal silencing factor RsfS [Clostridia bacterium]
MSEIQSKTMVQLVYHALEEKKAEDIRIINIQKLTVIADYFVIASANNENQIQALADNVQECLHQQGYYCKHVEGYRTAGWILLDYRDVIVHLFLKENRMFYHLERIWQDGQACSIHELTLGM